MDCRRKSGEAMTRGARSRAAALLLACLCAPAGRAGTQDVPSTPALVDRAVRYVEQYAADLRFVLADEDYVQRTFDEDGRATGERRMRGELYLAWLPADGVWIAVHDVAERDGVAVANREDLPALLRQGAVTSVARRVADRNASFNLGTIARNFNEPTLPLLLLGRARVRTIAFDREAVTAEAGRLRATLAFRERDRPTLVRSRAGGPARSRGTVVLDAVSGRIEATVLTLSVDGIRARLETAYGPDEKLGLWVPQVFTEHYEGSPDGRREVIVCEAKYSNYRRFEVTGRIKRE